jgi:hypothetical protein
MNHDDHCHVDHGDMTRDEREEWPKDVSIGTFDIDAGRGVQGYPGAGGCIIFVCPNGRRCAVLIGPQPVAKPSPNALGIWGWDGNLDRPTLTPSINCRNVKDDGTPASGCGWHGFIRNGVIA